MLIKIRIPTPCVLKIEEQKNENYKFGRYVLGLVPEMKEKFSVVFP